VIRWCWSEVYPHLRSTKRRFIRCTPMLQCPPTIGPRDGISLTQLAIYGAAALFRLGEASSWSRASITAQLRSLLLYRESQETPAIPFDVPVSSWYSHLADRQNAGKKPSKRLPEVCA